MAVMGALPLAGCGNLGGITGAIAGAASGAALANPAVGIAVGIGVQAGIDASIKTLLRHWSHEEQMRIAHRVGSMTVGQRESWRVQHAVPYKNAQGEVIVLRTFTTTFTTCKEAAFTVDDPESSDVGNTARAQQYFITTVCQDALGWRWANAEPAVDRWGALH